jgi:hypothetical protein
VDVTVRLIVPKMARNVNGRVIGMEIQGCGGGLF